MGLSKHSLGYHYFILSGKVVSFIGSFLTGLRPICYLEHCTAVEDSTDYNLRLIVLAALVQSESMLNVL